MAVFRILTQKWSLTSGPGGCLSWCFGTNQNKDPSADSKNLDPKNEKDYGTTSLDKNNGKPKANGNCILVILFVLVTVYSVTISQILDWNNVFATDSWSIPGSIKFRY